MFAAGNKLIFLLALFFLSKTFFCREKGKEWFLVDSLNYNSLSAKDKQNIDSVLAIFHSQKSDSIRMSCLKFLADNLSDEAVWPKYNEVLYAYSLKDPQKKLFTRFRSDAIINKGLNCKNQGDYKEAINLYNEALKLKEDIDDAVGVATALNNLGIIYSAKGNAGKANESFERCISILKKNGRTVELSAALNNIAREYEKEGNIFKALEYYGISLNNFRIANDKKGIASVLNNIGNIYSNQGNIAKAIEFFDKSLKAREELSDKRGIAESLSNIALLYFQQGEQEQAKQSYLRSLAIRKELKDKRGIALTLNNLGSVLKDTKDTAAALSYFTEALQIRQEINDKAGLAFSYTNIGGVYEIRNDFKSAENFYKKSLSLREEIGEKKNISLSLNALGALYFKEGRTKEAVPFLRRSLAFAKEIGLPFNMRTPAKLLSKYYKSAGDFKNALSYYELFIQMRDSISNQETRKAGIKQQIKHEYEKRSAADSVKNLETQKVKDAQLAAQNATLKQEKFQRYSLVVGLLIVLGGLGFVINRFRVTSKQKKIIEEQKVKVDQAFEKLHEKNKEVMDSIYYARRIQRALITSEHYISKNLNRLRTQDHEGKRD